MCCFSLSLSLSLSLYPSSIALLLYRGRYNTRDVRHMAVQYQGGVQHMAHLSSDRIGSECRTSPKERVGGHQCVRHPKVAAFIPPVPICTIAQACVQPDSVVGVDVIFMLDESTNRNGSCVARNTTIIHNNSSNNSCPFIILITTIFIIIVVIIRVIIIIVLVIIIIMLIIIIVLIIRLTHNHHTSKQVTPPEPCRAACSRTILHYMN